MHGSLECVRLLLSAGASPDGYSSDSEDWNVKYPDDSPLSVAANSDIAALLVKGGADINLGTYGENITISSECWKMLRHVDEIFMPISRAVLEGRIDVARFLIKAGVDADFLEGQPLRMLACASKSNQRVHFLWELLETGVNINGKSGVEPLRLATMNRCTALCKALLEAGAEPIQDAVAIAASNGDLQCLELFLDNGTGSPANALRHAAKHGRKEILFYLLGRYPELGWGEALHGAIEGCHFPLVREIINMGVPPDVRDENGLTALAKLYSLDRRRETWRCMINFRNEYAGVWKCRNRWIPDDLEDVKQWELNFYRPDNWNDLIARFEDEVMILARMLLENGADLSARDKKGRSVIWHACSMAWLKSIIWFSEMGADMLIRDRDGVNAFEAGCFSCESYTLKPMLKSGFDINTCDKNGNTALLKCAKENDEKNQLGSIIYFLLIYGSDPDLENNKGESFRKMAENNKNLAYELRMAEREKEES